MLLNYFSGLHSAIHVLTRFSYSDQIHCVKKGPEKVGNLDYDDHGIIHYDILCEAYKFCHILKLRLQATSFPPSCSSPTASMTKFTHTHKVPILYGFCLGRVLLGFRNRN